MAAAFRVLVFLFLSLVGPHLMAHSKSDETDLQKEFTNYFMKSQVMSKLINSLSSQRNFNETRNDQDENSIAKKYIQEDFESYVMRGFNFSELPDSNASEKNEEEINGTNVEGNDVKNNTQNSEKAVKGQSRAILTTISVILSWLIPGLSFLCNLAKC